VRHDACGWSLEACRGCAGPPGPDLAKHDLNPRIPARVMTISVRVRRGDEGGCWTGRGGASETSCVFMAAAAVGACSGALSTSMPSPTTLHGSWSFGLWSRYFAVLDELWELNQLHLERLGGGPRVGADATQLQSLHYVCRLKDLCITAATVGAGVAMLPSPQQCLRTVPSAL
jgi:hypothetical protein